MIRMKIYTTLAALTGVVLLSLNSAAAPITNAISDFAYIKGGGSVALATGQAAMKNATGINMKMVMYKLSTSSLVGKYTDASFSFVTKNDTACNLKVWGVKDSGATGWDWTGGETGDVTWNSVITKGLFTPSDKFATSYDPNEVVLLATIPVDGSGSPYNLVSTVTGSGLVDLLNADSDGIVTLVVTIDANVNLWARDPLGGLTPIEYTVTQEPTTLGLVL